MIDTLPRCVNNPELYHPVTCYKFSRIKDLKMEIHDSDLQKIIRCKPRLNLTYLHVGTFLRTDSKLPKTFFENGEFSSSGVRIPLHYCNSVHYWRPHFSLIFFI